MSAHRILTILPDNHKTQSSPPFIPKTNNASMVTNDFMVSTTLKWPSVENPYRTMKHEHVVPDYWKFLQYSGSYLFMAFCGLLLIRLIQAVFWLPGHLQNNQRKLEQLARKHNIPIDDDLPMVEEIQEPESEAEEPMSKTEEPKKDK